MFETVPRVVASPRRRPRARLLRGAPPPRARRIPPARVVVAPRVVALARRPPPSSWPTATATKKKYERRDGGGRQRPRWWQRTWPRRALGHDTGGDARRTTTRGTAAHRMCSPHRPSPCASVDSQSESPEQETRRMPIQLSPERARLRINNSRIFYFSARLSRI